LLLLVAVLPSCSRSSFSAAPESRPQAAPAPEATVTRVNGLEFTHTFHQSVDLAAFLKTLPSGSVDHVDFNDTRPYLIAVVNDVTSKGEATVPGKELPRGFETVFHTKGGEKLVKEWSPAEGNKSGKCSAVFVLPASAVRGETRPNDGP
jgi:hypothetical protein